jgi:hypothetical protein
MMMRIGDGIIVEDLLQEGVPTEGVIAHIGSHYVIVNYHTHPQEVLNLPSGRIVASSRSEFYKQAAERERAGIEALKETISRKEVRAAYFDGYSSEEKNPTAAPKD